MADIQTQFDIERLLFETGAISVAPENKPFWYTSGTIGPYYSNTQNLIGSKAEADKLLGIIDSGLCADRYMLPNVLMRHFLDAYANNACYHKVADCIQQCVNDNVNISEIDYISGGERRDWFFSFITAHLLKKPHVTIYKDHSMLISKPGDDGCPREITYSGDYAGKRCLHVSDIITEASSYVRAWVPAVEKAGMIISDSLTILDRMQGGGSILASLKVRSLSLAQLDASFFSRAYEHGQINQRQKEVLCDYIINPHETMAAFLGRHPEFIKDALSAGGKEAEKARLCIDSDIYGDIITNSCN